MSVRLGGNVQPAKDPQQRCIYLVIDAISFFKKPRLSYFSANASNCAKAVYVIPYTESDPESHGICRFRTKAGNKV